MNQRITQRMLRALGLKATERLMLLAFVTGHRAWVARHAVPLSPLLRRVLQQQGMQLLRLQQVEPHPVYEVWLRQGRSPLATSSEIERAVRRAFAAAGRSVKPKFTQAIIRGDRARVMVYVEG